MNNVSRILVACKLRPIDAGNSTNTGCHGFDCNTRFILRGPHPFDCSMFEVDWTTYLTNQQYLEKVKE